MFKLKKYYLIAKTSLQSNMAYSANFITGTFFYAFIIFIFFQLWKTIYGGNKALSGYSLKQIIWYCIITEMIVISRSNVFNDLNAEIKDGSIAYLLNRPYHYLLYQFSNGAGMMSLKLTINILTGFIIGFVYVGGLENFKLYSLPFVILSGIIGIFINFFMNMTIGMSSFWLEDNLAFFWIFQKLSFMFGVFLPIEFLPTWLKEIVLFLPFPYISYAPAKLAVDFSFERIFSLITIQILYLLFFIFISLFVYRRGVKTLNVNGG